MNATFDEALQARDRWLEQEKTEAVQRAGKKAEKEFDSLMSKNQPDFIRETVRGCELIVKEMDRKIHSFSTGGIMVDKGLWCLSVHPTGPGCFGIDFHVEIVPSDAARIAIEVFRIAATMDMTPEIGWPYTFELGEDGKSNGMLYGEDAYSYHFGQGVNYLDWDDDPDDDQGGD